MIGQTTFDRWTAVHVGSGVAMGYLHLSPLTVLAATVGFEIVEAYLRSHPEAVEKLNFIPKGFIEPESERNIVADVLAGWAGYSLGLSIGK